MKKLNNFRIERYSVTSLLLLLLLSLNIRILKTWIIYSFNKWTAILFELRQLRKKEKLNSIFCQKINEI